MISAGPKRRSELNRQLWERCVELLGDGRWHNYEATVAELVKLVPPGPAMRQSEKERIGQGRSQRHGHRGPAERVYPREVHRQIESGARSIVRIFLKSPYFEKDRHGDPRRRLPQRKIRMVQRS